MSDFYKESQPKARKHHCCHLCGKPILPGKEYVKEIYIYGRKFYENKRHIHCELLLEEFYLSEEPEVYFDEEVADWVYASACYDCPHSKKGDNSCADERTTACFACEVAQKRILKPNVWDKARKSVLDNHLENDGKKVKP